MFYKIGQIPDLHSKFETGSIVATIGVIDLIENNKIGHFDLIKSIRRHCQCDWGDMDKHDKNLNDLGFKNNNDRLFSAYILTSNIKIWIITEWDRSVTTILLPEEY